MEIYTVTTPPSELPVTLAEAKAYLRVTASNEDDIITALLNTAVNDLENYTQRWFITRTARADYDFLETSNFEMYQFAEIRKSPLGLITSIEIIQGGSGVAVTDTITKDNPKAFARILFTESLPTADTDVARPLQIVFTAGYGAAADVPEDIKTSIKKYVQYGFSNRGACGDDPGLVAIRNELSLKGYKIQTFWGGCI